MAQSLKLKSNSLIQTFKSCRRLYELRYVYGLEYTAPIDTLERGKSYHSKIDSLVMTGCVISDGNLKTTAMALAFEKYIMPYLPSMIEVTEEWIRKPIPNSDSVFVGRVDGLLSNGAIIEHKTTSGAIDEAYIDSLFYDEQILSYLWVKNVLDMVYCVCRTPTIRQKTGESDEAFVQRCLEWYAEDTDSKIRAIHVTRTAQELAEFESQLTLMAREIDSATFFYRNQAYCTKWGRHCEYAQVCGAYDPSVEYVNYRVRDRSQHMEEADEEKGEAPF